MAAGLFFSSLLSYNCSGSSRQVPSQAGRRVQLAVRQRITSRPRTIFLAALIALLSAQLAISPFLRNWQAQVAAFEAELIASLCSEHVNTSPDIPRRDHCPDMQCCLLARQLQAADPVGDLTSVDFQLPKLFEAEARPIWPALPALRTRPTSSEVKARAPPA